MLTNTKVWEQIGSLAVGLQASTCRSVDLQVLPNSSVRPPPRLHRAEVLGHVGSEGVNKTSNRYDKTPYCFLAQKTEASRTPSCKHWTKAITLVPLLVKTFWGHLPFKDASAFSQTMERARTEHEYSSEFILQQPGVRNAPDWAFVLCKVPCPGPCLLAAKGFGKSLSTPSLSLKNDSKVTSAC